MVICDSMNLTKVLEYLKKYENSNPEKIPRYYFRGQTEDFGPITASLARKPKNLRQDDKWEVLRSQAYTMCRYAYEIANGIKGTIYSARPDEGLALMQHYGWLSPLIDVTGTIDVAIFFAWLKHMPDVNSVVYVFDREMVKPDDDIEFIGHDFLLQDLSREALYCRWFRQDGYAITPRRRLDMQEVLQFDLHHSPCLADVVHFQFDPDERPGKTDYMDITNNPLPRHVQSLMRSATDQFIGAALSPYLAGLIDNMFIPPADTLGELSLPTMRENLFRYGTRFTINFLRSSVRTVEKQEGLQTHESTLLYRRIAEMEKIKNWESSVYCTGNCVFDKIASCASANQELVEKLVSVFRETFTHAREYHFKDLE